jgi:hypothetical protein
VETSSSLASTASKESPEGGSGLLEARRRVDATTSILYRDRDEWGEWVEVPWAMMEP